MAAVEPQRRPLRFWLVQAITAARIPLGIALAVTLLVSGYTPAVAWICVGLLTVIELSDAVDGWLARKLKVASEAGATLDPYCDSISRIIVYWALAESDLTLAVVPLVMALRDVSVAYCRMIWIRQGRSVAAKLSGKLKAIVQGAAAFVLVLAPVFFPKVKILPDSASWAVILVTIYSGLDYVARLKSAPSGASR